MKFITATIADVGTIQEIAHECWPVAYSAIISEEQIAYMLNKMYSAESLAQQMTQEGCEFVIALLDTIPIGFASLSMLQNGNIKLHKLYLASTEKGKGYGRALLDEVLNRAIKSSAKGIELQVNKMNPAQHFYLNYGFTMVAEIILDIGNGFVMDDYIMHYKL